MNTISIVLLDSPSFLMSDTEVTMKHLFTPSLCSSNPYFVGTVIWPVKILIAQVPSRRHKGKAGNSEEVFPFLTKRNS